MRPPSTVAKIKAYSVAKREGLELSESASTSVIRWGAKLLETSWFERVLMRLVAAGAGSLTIWLVAHNAGDLVKPIVTGLVSFVIFVTEILSSWLHKKAGLPDKHLVRPDPSIVERIIDKKITPVTEAAPVEVALQQAAEESPSNAPGQRFAIPGALDRQGFPNDDQLEGEVKRLLPPAPPNPDERIVEFREQFSLIWQTRVCPNFSEALKFRTEMRTAGLIANIQNKKP